MYVPTPQTVADLTVTGTAAYDFMRGLPTELLNANRKRMAPHGLMYDLLADACYTQRRISKASHMNAIEGGWSRSVFTFSDRSCIVVYTDYYDHNYDKPTIKGAHDFAVATSEEFLPFL
jgi:hypothetical protein